MCYKKFRLCVILLSGLGLTGLLAQESVNAGGGDASGSGGTAGYSVGQVVCQTYTGTDGLAAAGVQLPYEIWVVTGIDDVPGINLLVSAFPNPATDHITLSIEEEDLSGLSYQLYNMNGRLLKNEKITDNLTSIDMSMLPQAVYFVKVSRANSGIKTFKIIKN